MARPRKSTVDEWLDTFADWSVDDQKSALQILGAIHRQKNRSGNGKAAGNAVMFSDEEKEPVE